jgi:hypothetical protein
VTYDVSIDVLQPCRLPELDANKTSEGLEKNGNVLLSRRRRDAIEDRLRLPCSSDSNSRPNGRGGLDRMSKRRRARSLLLNSDNEILSRSTRTLRTTPESSIPGKVGFSPFALVSSSLSSTVRVVRLLSILLLLASASRVGAVDAPLVRPSVGSTTVATVASVVDVVEAVSGRKNDVGRVEVVATREVVWLLGWTGGRVVVRGRGRWAGGWVGVRRVVVGRGRWVV